MMPQHALTFYDPGVDSALVELVDAACARDGRIVALTGAGISAESGIPTFRGSDGYWTVGSRVYHPQELATHAAFVRMPIEVWQWYLYRRGVCRAAQPNRAHVALATLGRALGDRFRLITQNVDGLHLRAGSSLDHTYQIHGNIDFMRCSAECSPHTTPIPQEIGAIDRDQVIGPAELALLVCARCGARARPHVLWFDESYDEPRFRFHSSLEAAASASLLISIGTSGGTTLPNHVVALATQAGAAFIDVNPEPNPFSILAQRHASGAWLRATACDGLPPLIDAIARTAA
jgi:NAD-dependent deacetylase